MGNCDRHLVLAFQDERTARYFSTRAGRTPTTLLETPQGTWWLFCRGQKGVADEAYQLERHPRYQDFCEKRDQARAQAEEVLSPQEVEELFAEWDARLAQERAEEVAF